MNVQPCELTLIEASDALSKHDLSPVELVDSILARIDAVEPKIGAFVTVLAEESQREAKEAEREILNGNHRGPLHGIPVGVKYIFDTAGTATTASSKQRHTYIPDADAEVVSRLRAGGAIIIGKTRLDEFAFGGVTPGTSNPWHLERIAGGSSGGSAAAVAANECLVAVGTDTGGSLRIPAAFCGTVGFKPTYGLLSTRGVAALSWSLDHAGPIARNVLDAATTLDMLIASDSAHHHRAQHLPPDHRPSAAVDRDVEGLVVGVPTNHVFDRLDPDVENVVRQTISTLQAEGAQIREVELPLTSLYLPVEWAILLPEAAAYHQRTLREAPDKYTEGVRSFLEVGELVFATDYIKALRGRNLIKEAWRAMFEDTGLDVVISPTLPLTAPLKGEEQILWPDGTAEPLVPLLGQTASPANITGLPAMSIPCGTDRQGLPVGLQVVGQPFEEATVVHVGAACERLSAWDTQTTPPGVA